MKGGTCPAVFDFLEEDNMKKDKNMSMSMRMMGMGDKDMRGGRRHGMWGKRGLPERPMEDFNGGGLFETLRDWLSPPDMEMMGSSGKDISP